MWELSGRELPTQLCFPPHLASAFTFPLVQVLIQGIVSPNPALYSEGFSQDRQLDQVALHAGDLPQSESRGVTAA